jgi:hypothetical protein
MLALPRIMGQGPAGDRLRSSTLMLKGRRPLSELETRRLLAASLYDSGSELRRVS